jgi:diamine N-acetyltransferase
MTLHVILRPTTEADLAFVIEAENHPENAQFIGNWTRSRHAYACQHPDERHRIITVFPRGAAVGYVILSGIQDPDQNLLIKRLVITEKGKGYGRAALEAVLHEAFHEFKAHRVWLDVMVNNQRAASLYESLGCIKEGCLREAKKTAQGYVSLWVMSILRQEFFKERAEIAGAEDASINPSTIGLSAGQ